MKHHTKVFILMLQMLFLKYLPRIGTAKDIRDLWRFYFGFLPVWENLSMKHSRPVESKKAKILTPELFIFTLDTHIRTNIWSRGQIPVLPQSPP